MATFERTLDEATKFLEENPVSMPIIFDDEGEMAEIYLNEGLPTTFFINEDGIVVDKVVGEVTKEMIEERIEYFL
ncbi:TlpA family protein disulfide reductase [Bacillus daqingensis]|uniref:TlpA family protein disulfide reductase n=1 Tax=Bacillus daqingensis TaxID=872396 RepID=A0ABV9NQG2_9BACI|nr:TlpA disulfide reductase family protein [Alkalibacillus haloalkaliphilus]